MEEETKICPYCGKEIKKIAKKCRYCGKWLDENNQSNNNEPKTKQCPICGEEIQIDSVKCEHCGEPILQNKTSKKYVLIITKLLLFFIITYIIIITFIRIWGLLPVVYNNFFESPINELTSGCTNNGEDVMLSLNEGIGTKYYCKGKLWKNVTKYKNPQAKYYNYSVENSLAEREWRNGEYVCSYAWKGNGNYSPCSEVEFVEEVKKGLASREFTPQTYQYLESKLLKNCTYLKQEDYSGLIRTEYSCKYSNWNYVVKTVYSDSKYFKYDVGYLFNKHIPLFSATITWKYGKYYFRGTPCSEDEFINFINSPNITATIKSNRYMFE